MPILFILAILGVIAWMFPDPRDRAPVIDAAWEHAANAHEAFRDALVPWTRR